MKGRVGERSSANCVLDGINEGESVGKHSFAFTHSARASFRKLGVGLSILQEVYEQDTAFGTYRQERSSARMKTK